MSLTWIYKREYDTPEGRHGWFGNRSDGTAFHNYSKSAFDGYLDENCNCSLTQQDETACPVHKEL